MPDTSVKPLQMPPIVKRDVKGAFSDLLEHVGSLTVLLASVL